MMSLNQIRKGIGKMKVNELHIEEFDFPAEDDESIAPLVLTEKGFVYKGEVIEDNGQAYALFMDAVQKWYDDDDA